METNGCLDTRENNSNKNLKHAKTPVCLKVESLIVIDAFPLHLQVEQSNFRCTDFGYAYNKL